MPDVEKDRIHSWKMEGTCRPKLENIYQKIPKYGILLQSYAFI